MAPSREQTRRPRRVPARVYWVRRVMVLGTAALMVFAIGRLLVGSSDGADSASSNPGAVQAAASITPSVSSSGPTILLPTGTQKPRKSKPPKPTATPLAQPSGPCAADDVVVAPEARTPVGGGDVVFALSFRTLVSPACTFDVSAKTITMSITSGADPIWSSVQCPAKIPTTNVVARKDLATYVFVTWNGRRADATCSNRTEWALPGWYHVRVAAFGGEPADEQFELAAPLPATVTTTVIPDPEPTKKPKKPKNG